MAIIVVNSPSRKYALSFAMGTKEKAQTCVKAIFHDNYPLQQYLAVRFQRQMCRSALISVLLLSALSTAGQQHIEFSRYRLKSLSFQHSTVFSADELVRQFPISPGEKFDASKIRKGLDNVRSLYCRAGYVNFVPIPAPQLDDATHTISLVVDVDEGALFSYGELTVLGEESEPGARQKLVDGWKPYRGKPYDCGHSLESFLRDVHARPLVKPEQILKTTMDVRAHTMNVEMTLATPPLP